MNTDNVIGKFNFLSRHHNFSAFVVFVCLSMFALNANPFADQTVAPFDRLLQFPGWYSVQNDRNAVHAERSDILDSQLPTWITLKAQVRKGETPLWYPNGAGGQPISLELCNPVFLLFVAIKDNALAYYLVGLVKLVISGFGCYLLLRTFLRWLPSVWGGMVFMLCGFNAAWFFWEHVSTAMWIPWLLWTAVMYLKTEERKWLPAITVVSVLLIFGGFPAAAAYGFYAFVLVIVFWNVYALAAGNWRTALRDAGNLKFFTERTAFPLLAVCIAFMMASVALIPFRDGLSAINLGYRIGGGTFFQGLDDFRLFAVYERPSPVERTAFVGFAVLIFSVAGIFSGFRTRDGNVRKFIFSHVLLVALSTLIAFGLLPHEIIRAIPVFSSNSWSRFIVVPLLGLAVLSSVGLDFLLGALPAFFSTRMNISLLNARRSLVAVVIVITVFQFSSQKELFNHFNAVVPSSWLYPVTPSIAYVKENLKPLQSVIADYSYLFSGTLGAYGIPEWYAHSFRTDREKEVLSELVRDPFSSATSAFINGANIQFNSPLMDKLAIKYLLVNKGALGMKQLFALPELSRDPAPPLPHNSWKQHINIPDDMVIEAVGFLFSTYGEVHAPANVKLTVYTDKGEKYSVEPELGRNEIANNQWTFFAFPDRFLLKKGGYYLVMSLPGYSGSKSLTAWATKNQENTGSFLEINGVRTDYSLTWKIGYIKQMAPSSLEKKWNIIDLENEIVIFENKQVTNSAYFIKDLAPSDNQTDFSGLDVTHVAVDQIDINYLRRESGWIVLPMHLHPDWKAYLDNREVKYEAYLDMLPAIPVSGPAHLIFKYQPQAFWRGLTVSLAGVFIFLAFSGFCLRKTKERQKPSV